MQPAVTHAWPRLPLLFPEAALCPHHLQVTCARLSSSNQPGTLHCRQPSKCLREAFLQPGHSKQMPGLEGTRLGKQ